MSGSYRLRIRYAKRDRLRFLSHLEITRALERMIRRAALPYAVTQGFNPHMKIAFGSALPVGVGSEDEYFDVWLTEFVEPEIALLALRQACVPKLAPLGAKYVHEKEPSLSASLVFCRYEATFSLEGIDDVANFEHRLEGVLDALSTGELEVQKKGKTRTFDLGSTLWETPRLSVGGDSGSIRFGVRSLKEGTLRPDLFLKEVRDRTGGAIDRFCIERIAQFAEGETGKPEHLFS